MNNNTVLVLGTGATPGGRFQVKIGDKSFEPPLDRNFFESPAVQVLLRTGYPALAHYGQGPGLEATWAKIDLLAKLCLSGVISEEQTYECLQDQMAQRGQSDPSYQRKMDRECCHSRVPSMAGWELLNLVRMVYLDPCAPKPTWKSPLYNFVDALLRENLLYGVITFNYDISLEILFPVPGQFYYPLLHTDKTADRLPLMKLHGSLNWQESRKQQQITAADQIADMNYRSPDDWTQPAIIGPTFFKQEITADSQQDYRAKFYKELWRFAWDRLRNKNVRNLIFIGFSFPQTDFHVKALFHTAHLSGSRFQQVILCHKNDPNIHSTAKQVFARRPPNFTCFPEGLENMAERVDEVMALLRS